MPGQSASPWLMGGEGPLRAARPRALDCSAPAPAGGGPAEGAAACSGGVGARRGPNERNFKGVLWRPGMCPANIHEGWMRDNDFFYPLSLFLFFYLRLIIFSLNIRVQEYIKKSPNPSLTLFYQGQGPGSRIAETKMCPISILNHDTRHKCRLIVGVAV